MKCLRVSTLPITPPSKNLLGNLVAFSPTMCLWVACSCYFLFLMSLCNPTSCNSVTILAEVVKRRTLRTIILISCQSVSGCTVNCSFLCNRRIFLIKYICTGAVVGALLGLAQSLSLRELLKFNLPHLPATSQSFISLQQIPVTLCQRRVLALKLY